MAKAKATAAPAAVGAPGDRLQNLGDIFKLIRSGVIADALALFHDLQEHDWAKLGVDGPKLLMDLGLAEDAAAASKIIADIQSGNYLKLLTDSIAEIQHIFDELNLAPPPGDAPIRMMAAATASAPTPGGVLGLRLRLAGQLARKEDIGYFEAYSRLRKIENQKVLEAAHTAAVKAGFKSPFKAGESVGAFDGHLIAQLFAWIKAHPEIIAAILSLLMMFLGPVPNGGA